MFDRQNSIDDDKPWAIIRVIAPVSAHWVCTNVEAITRPIWLTDE